MAVFVTKKEIAVKKYVVKLRARSAIGWRPWFARARTRRRY